MTFDSSRTVLPFSLILISYGPPTSTAGRSILKLPSLSALPVTVLLLSFISIALPGSHSFPQMQFCLSRCNTRPSLIKDDNFIFIPLFNISFCPFHHLYRICDRNNCSLYHTTHAHYQPAYQIVSLIPKTLCHRSFL